MFILERPPGGGGVWTSFIFQKNSKNDYT